MIALVLLLALAGSADAEWRQVELTAYCPCKKCCGKSADGITSSGQRFRAGQSLAADPSIPFGTRIYVDGSWRVVDDRGSDIVGNKLDLGFKHHQTAKRFGRKTAWAWIERKDR